jgi:1-acyl-sn-glycerol-3-phosphate acyltransferase
MRALEQGRVVPMFPEGRILPTSGRELGVPMHGVAFIVLHARVPVIPAYVWGTPETNTFGTALRTPSHAHVVFGAPISAAEIAPEGPVDTDKATLAAVSERLMDSIRALHASVQDGRVSRMGNPKAAVNGRDGAQRPEGTPGPVSGDRATARGA